MPEILVIACGALAHEIVALQRAGSWNHLKVQCLPAELHNTPGKIHAAVREQLDKAMGRYTRVFVAYGDCGTGGALDRLLAEYGVERLPGAHCYQIFAGRKAFETLADAEPGTFYLTDFLARHFERLVWRGLALDRHPELLPLLFGNYRKVIYLAQTEQPALRRQAQRAAEKLGLAFEHRSTGYGELQTGLTRFAEAL